MSLSMNRRTFVGAASAIGAATVVPRHVLGGPGQVAPNDKIAVGHIGLGTQSIRELGHLLENPAIQIVSICDPNTDSNDYIEWGKGGILRTIRGYLDDPSWRSAETGCPAGREVGREIVEGYYARTRGAGNYKSVSLYSDFRDMIANESGIDAVKIMTPDHAHATLAIAAMKKGWNVAMHKPVANRLREGRRVLDVIGETGASTHLLAYGSGQANGQVCEKIKQGVIGRLREVHNWTNRPVWPQYAAIPADRPPIPEGLDWQLWLGPEQDRPFHPHYTHSVYRGWYDFGGGSMADMGIYSLWPVFDSLGLDAPLSAEAFATHTCTIEDGVSRTVNNDFAYPIASMQRFEFAAKGDRGPVDLFWYDGGMKPRLPEALEKAGAEMDREGILYVGDDGVILAEFHGRDPVLYKNGKSEPLPLDVAWHEDAPENPWLAAMRGEASPGSFVNAAAITDAVNLGSIAIRRGKKLHFDSDAMKITNDPAANDLLTRNYREGWEI